MKIGLVLAFILAQIALINPNFTPINLIEESQVVQIVSFNSTGKNTVECTVTQLIKGEDKSKSFKIDSTKAVNASTTKAINDLIASSKGEPGVFFSGKFVVNEGDEPTFKAFLHVSGKWIVLTKNDKGVWEAQSIDTGMEATWAGGTDMLIKAIDYIMNDDDPSVPVNEGVEWEDNVQIDTVEGDITSIRPVDINGDGKLHAFLASVAGDKLYVYDEDEEEMLEVTEDIGLTSKSSRYAWVDLNTDGHLDLVSYDGKSYAFYQQGKDGKFAAANNAFIEVGAGKCTGLFTVHSGSAKQGALLISTDKGLQLFKAGAFPLKPQLIANGGHDVSKFGKIGTCLVADLNGDNIADAIQLFEFGSLLYKGTAPGTFAPAIPHTVALGKKQSAACVGDFDANGLIDIFTAAEDGNQIWHNYGKYHFMGSVDISGEIAYIGNKSEALDVSTCDINNDGRHDVFLAYYGYSPQLFFNRGFRSFGHAHMLDLSENGLVPQSMSGQKTGCVADFNNDGAQDMIIILSNGEIHYFYRASEGEDSLGIKVRVDNALHGSVNVSGYLDSGDGQRALGTWSVKPGSPVLIGLTEAGPCTLKWTLPGGKEQSKEIIVEDEPVHFVIK